MRRGATLRAVVFDLDGTLMDSLPLVLAAIQHAIEPYGGKTSMDIFAHLGGPPERFLAELVGDVSRVPAAVRRLQTYHDENYHLIRPFDGARELLEGLVRAGIQVALWTGRDRESTQVLLRAHAMAPLLATFVCGDDLPTHKPDPAGLREILQRLELSTEEIMLVGDADVDVLGGHACGVDTMLIRHGRSIRREIESKCWQVVSSPADAYAAVRGCVVAGP